MYSRDQFLDKSAKGVLENHKREQEERQAAMARKLKEEELKKLQAQLFYKQQEVRRVKSSHDRMRREAIVEEGKVRKGEMELQNKEREIKDIENRLAHVDIEIGSILQDLGKKISDEKAVIAEHERKIQELESKKRDAEADKNLKKRTLTESFSRLMFFKKREGQSIQQDSQKFKSHQVHIQSLERSLSTFTQEIKVLENKIRALHSNPL